MIVLQFAQKTINGMSNADFAKLLPKLGPQANAGDVVYILVADAHEHPGQFVVYAGENGIVPPLDGGGAKEGRREEGRAKVVLLFESSRTRKPRTSVASNRHIAHLTESANSQCSAIASLDCPEVLRESHRLATTRLFVFLSELGIDIAFPEVPNPLGSVAPLMASIPQHRLPEPVG